MEDSRIVELYFARSEEAIAETDRKYGRFCYGISYNILGNGEDTEESVNDTYMAAWNAMPPHRPDVLKSFLGKLARRIAIKRYRGQTAAKRGGGQAEAALEELGWCIPQGARLEERLELEELTAAIDAFLRTLPDTDRRVFICRYWYLEPIADIAGRFGFTQGRVKNRLFRLREKLARYLTKEGLIDGR